VDFESCRSSISDIEAGSRRHPADVLGRLERSAAIGVDTVYFHLYDALDFDHARLLGQEAAAHA
jgi:hypothetical protein